MCEAAQRPSSGSDPEDEPMEKLQDETLEPRPPGLLAALDLRLHD